LVSSVSLAVMLLSAVPGGAVADSVERRAVMLVCGACGAVSSAALAAAILTGAVSLPLILGLAVVGSAASTVYGPASSALLRAVVPSERLAAATARLQARTAAARLAGPLLGGLLYAVAPAWPFVIQAAGHLVALLCTLAIRTRSVPHRTATTTSRSPWRELLFAGFGLVWRRPYLRTPLLIFGCVLNAAFGAAMLVAVAVGASADPSGRLVGLISALSGAGTLLGGLLAAKLPVQAHLRGMILLTCWTATVAVGTLAVTPPVLLGVVFGGCMLVAALGNVAFVTMLLRCTPDHLLGRVQAAATAVSMVAQPAGPVLGGYLYERLGASVTFSLLGLACLGSSMVAVRARGLRELPQAGSEASAAVETVASPPRATR
jgi:MFS family permease